MIGGVCSFPPASYDRSFGQLAANKKKKNNMLQPKSTSFVDASSKMNCPGNSRACELELQTHEKARFFSLSLLCVCVCERTVGVVARFSVCPLSGLFAPTLLRLHI